MKIAIVHEMCVKIWGAEKVVQSFLKQYPDADLYALMHDTDKMGDFFWGRKINTPAVTQRIYKLFKNQRLCLPFMPRAIESLDFSDYDVVIASSSWFAHGAITKPETKFIVYSHAPARYLWDFTNEYKKQIGFNEGIKSYFLNKLFLRLRIWDFMAGQRADTTLANSGNTQNRITKYHRKTSVVLYPPIETSRFQKALKENELSNRSILDYKTKDYYIVISALTGFKRIDLAIAGFNEMPDKNLIIIWAWDLSIELKSQVNWGNIELVWPQYGDDLVFLVQNSMWLIFPGEEDFWMVPVEVLSAWRPVFALAKGWLLETVQPWVTWEFFSDTEGSDFVEKFKLFDKNNIENKYTSDNCVKSAEKFSEENFLKTLKDIVWD